MRNTFPDDDLHRKGFVVGHALLFERLHFASMCLQGSILTNVHYFLINQDDGTRRVMEETLVVAAEAVEEAVVKGHCRHFHCHHFHCRFHLYLGRCGCGGGGGAGVREGGVGGIVILVTLKLVSSERLGDGCSRMLIRPSFDTDTTNACKNVHKNSRRIPKPCQVTCTFSGHFSASEIKTRSNSLLGGNWYLKVSFKVQLKICEGYM